MICSNNVLPVEWDKRKLILIIDKTMIEKLYRDEFGSDLIFDDQVCILTIPLKNDKISDFIIKNNYDVANTLLIQNPYNRNTYANITSFYKEFSMQKFIIFRELCSFLGAKEFIIKETLNCSEEKIHNNKVAIESLYTNVGTDIINQKSSDFSRIFESKCCFNGTDPDREKAIQLLETKNLSYDSELCSLIELRTNNKNPITSYDVSLKVFEESNKMLNIVSNLQIPSILSSVNHDLKINTSIKKEYDLRISITF